MKSAGSNETAEGAELKPRMEEQRKLYLQYSIPQSRVAKHQEAPHQRDFTSWEK